jgi:hypothetical protein
MASRPLPLAGVDPMRALRRRLNDEFGASVPPEAIDRAAAEALSELHGARVREYVSVLAWRRARARLRRRAVRVV